MTQCSAGKHAHLITWVWGKSCLHLNYSYATLQPGIDAIKCSTKFAYTNGMSKGIILKFLACPLDAIKVCMISIVD